MVFNENHKLSPRVNLKMRRSVSQVLGIMLLTAAALTAVAIFSEAEPCLVVPRCFSHAAFRRLAIPVDLRSEIQWSR